MENSDNCDSSEHRSSVRGSPCRYSECEQPLGLIIIEQLVETARSKCLLECDNIVGVTGSDRAV